MMAADLFLQTKPPRKKPRVLMHVIDAGDGAEFGTPHCARFKCKTCKRETDWSGYGTITEIKRGIPCDNCNSDGRE